MKVLCILVFSALLCTAVAQLNFNFTYTNQDEWNGLCNSDSSTIRRSPINIVTSDVVENDDLIQLELTDQWSANLDGVLSNSGFSGAQFRVNEGPLTFNTHLGMYEVLNVHMHWGLTNNEGTGHQIDGQRFGVEFHFPAVKPGTDLSMLGPETPGDQVAVISVLGEADSTIQISGIWEKLDVSMIVNRGDMINVTGLNNSMLLPANRDYYFYEGGQTSPGCYEFVLFFVMKERIKVPSEWINQLRSTQYESGAPITTSIRNVQQLSADHNVYIMSGMAVKQVMKPILVVVSMILFYIFTF